jgi:anti-sigma B factor antagonist
VVRADEEVIVAVRGQIDIASAPELWDQLTEVIPDTKRLVLDLGETEFIDSTALSVIVRALKRLRHGGGDLVIRAPRANARKVFKITGLDRVLTIED